MNKCVYFLNDRAKTTQNILGGQGFELLIGNDDFNGEMLAKCGALLSGRGYVTKEILQKAPLLKVICKTGVGVDRIDVQACTERGVCVANTPQSNGIAVAEHAMTLMAAVAKQVYPVSLYLRREYPEYGCVRRYPSVELYGKTLALIGLGNIGSRVARMANGFDMKIIGVDPYVNRSKIPDFIELFDSLEEALPRADFVSLHVAGIEANRNLIGAREFAMMKPTAIFINTTRGFIVDEKALYDALHGKVIAGAGVDVFHDEPLKPGNPLMYLENLVATPHSASNTPESRQRAEIQCAQIIMDYYAGKRPQSAVNDTPIG
jgi:D-3-phosphoglycerate dehydrogenase